MNSSNNSSRSSGHDLSPPIAALASGTGGAAVSLLRISGAGCHALLAPCLAGGSLPPPHQLRLNRICDPASGELLDEAMVVIFRAPKSYTGEDSAEVHCHGGPYIVRRLLELFYRLGIRAAEPGEFTRRAFLNGKLDLTAAEGIRALVEAQSHQQWIAARHLSTGRLRERIEALRTALIGALAYLAAQIDFPDEGDVEHLQLTHVRTQVEATRQQLRQLLATYADGRVASEGLRVVLFGEPNAGKSTLMNELLGRERAIVSPYAGTTRDYLEESCLISGRLLRLIDVAGMRADGPAGTLTGSSIDPVEAIGIARARELAQSADLVVFLLPADAVAVNGLSPPGQLLRWQDELQPKSSLVVLSKADLGRPLWAPAGSLAISCATGSGLAECREALLGYVDAHVRNLNEEAGFISSARQAAALAAAEEALDRYCQADAAGAYAEMLAFELQEAARHLAAIIGEVGTEAVLDRVFGEFCLGK